MDTIKLLSVKFALDYSLVNDIVIIYNICGAYVMDSEVLVGASVVFINLKRVFKSVTLQDIAVAANVGLSELKQAYYNTKMHLRAYFIRNKTLSLSSSSPSKDEDKPSSSSSSSSHQKMLSPPVVPSVLPPSQNLFNLYLMHSTRVQNLLFRCIPQVLVDPSAKPLAFAPAPLMNSRMQISLLSRVQSHMCAY